MRGVLVDDHDAVAGLGDDVGAVDLRSRGPEARLSGLGFGGRRTDVGGGRAGMLEGRLLLGEPDG